MTAIDVLDSSGAKSGSVDLDDKIFGAKLNEPLLHQVVTAQLAARRSGTQSTKTRSEVAGGGAKPWRQKGTGRARFGSSRVPQWRGGGVALGPKPRSYAQRTPKKMIRQALYSALSARASDDKIVVLDDWGFDAPSTKAAVQLLDQAGLTGRVLVVIDPTSVSAAKSFRNIPAVHLCTPGELNAHDVLLADWVVFTTATLPGANTGSSTSGEADTATSTPEGEG